MEALPPVRGEIARLVQGWLVSLSGRSEATAKRYMDGVRTALPLIAEYGGPDAIGSVEAAAIYRRLLEEFEPSTANVVLSSLSALWTYLAEHGVRLGNPWMGVKRTRPKEVLSERILTEEEVAAMVRAAAPGVERLLIKFLYYTGCRVSEAVSLTWRDVHPDREGWAVTVYGKRQKTRVVHIPDFLHEELVGCRLGEEAPLIPDNDGRPLDRCKAWRIVKRVAKRARVTRKVSPHWFRHSHATHALDRGAPLQYVQATLGHANIATTARYLHVMPGRGSGDVLPKL